MDQEANFEIRSECLLLRPAEGDGVEELHSLWTDEQVRRFLWDGEVIPLERTQEIVEKSRVLFDECGFGIWGIHEHGSNELLGFSGYWYFRTPPTLELLFGVGSGHWNRGIATESGRSVIRNGFEELGFATVRASTDSDNIASVRVLEKLGMRLNRRETVEGLDTLFFRLTRKDWENCS